MNTSRPQSSRGSAQPPPPRRPSRQETAPPPPSMHQMPTTVMSPSFGMMSSVSAAPTPSFYDFQVCVSFIFTFGSCDCYLNDIGLIAWCDIPDPHSDAQTAPPHARHQWRLHGDGNERFQTVFRVGGDVQRSFTPPSDGVSPPSPPDVSTSRDSVANVHTLLPHRTNGPSLTCKSFREKWTLLVLVSS